MSTGEGGDLYYILVSLMSTGEGGNSYHVLVPGTWYEYIKYKERFKFW